MDGGRYTDVAKNEEGHRNVLLHIKKETAKYGEGIHCFERKDQ